MNILMISECPVFTRGMVSELENKDETIKLHTMDYKQCRESDEAIDDISVILVDGTDAEYLNTEIVSAVLRIHYPELPVVMMLSKFNRTLFNLLPGFQVQAVVERSLSIEDLVRTLKFVKTGMFCIYSESIDNHRMKGENPLSDRQKEILGLIAAGKSNKEIGRRLNISPGTVKNHLEAIFRRLNVHNRTQAAKFYYCSHSA
jgi:DNA-binding NarL/FixJ family response regulator